MREPKKSETIEVRLPYDRKAAFMAHCQGTGRTASKVVRDWIDRELEPRAPSQTRSPMRRRALLSGSVALALAIGLSMATPSTRTRAAVPDVRPVFDQLDRNSDGILDSSEFGGTPASSNTNCKTPVFVIPLAHQAMPDARGTRGFALLADDISFRAIDWDRNGQITFEEYSANWTQAVRRGFTLLDRDGNGTIDASEYERVKKHSYQAGTARPAAATFAELDRDQNGRVSWTEFTT